MAGRCKSILKEQPSLFLLSFLALCQVDARYVQQRGVDSDSDLDGIGLYIIEAYQDHCAHCISIHPAFSLSLKSAARIFGLLILSQLKVHRIVRRDQAKQPSRLVVISK
jgi:hypothetical protein